jgi:hypothetical protein
MSGMTSGWAGVGVDDVRLGIVNGSSFSSELWA